MKVSFTRDGWDDLTYWIETDRKKLARITRLIKDTSRHPFEGIGDPEPLKHERSGWWSRRIDQEHRLIYRVSGTGESQTLEIAQCRHHY